MTSAQRIAWAPATLSDAQDFQNELCARCVHDQAWRNGQGILRAKGGCAILAASLACRPGDPHHPDAWSTSPEGYACAYFEDVAAISALASRCPHSLDMFDEASP